MKWILGWDAGVWMGADSFAIRCVGTEVTRALRCCLDKASSIFFPMYHVNRDEILPNSADRVPLESFF